jgi:uncharacterized membrane protein YagU involved in acid resistance
MPIVMGLIGLISGYVGTKAMEPVTTKLYGMESAADKAREKIVQPKTSFVVAAEKVAGLLGRRLDDTQASRLGGWFHYALGASWGLVYVIVRALTGWHPLALGLGLGVAMFLLVDEGANTVFRFTAPPDRFPAAAHLRGFIGHLVYGLGLAVAAEILFWLVGLRF